MTPLSMRARVIPPALALIASLTLHAAAAADDQGVWAPLVPPWRIGHSAVYDPLADRVLIFGGQDFARDVLFDDVWEFSFGPDPGWKRITTEGAGPAARLEHSAIFDAPRNRIIVFGGRTDDVDTRFNDVWALDLAGVPTWSELLPPAPLPRARYSHSATYDPVRERMVVFGGTFDSHTWTLTLAGAPEWTDHETDSGVFGGDQWTRHSAIYDEFFDRVLIFAGDHGMAIGAKNDTWMLTLDEPMTLTELETVGGPPPAREEHTAFYDTRRDRMVVFGGSPGVGDDLNDTWELSLPALGVPTWTEIAPGGRLPVARDGHIAVADPPRDRMFVFGRAVDADTWELSLAAGGAWEQLSPVPRISHAAVYDAPRGRMLVFGGIDFFGESSELWSLTLGDHALWSRVVTSGVTPPRRWGHSAIYEPLSERMIVFGGVGDGALLGDAHALALVGDPPVWTSIEPIGPRPAPRRDHTAMLDPLRTRMIVHDGVGGVEDVWALDLAGGGGWMELLPLGGPPADRDGHTAIYDVVRDRMVTFAGDGSATCLNDLWVLNMAVGEVWDELVPEGGGLPSTRSDHTAIYDTGRNRMLVFAGECDRDGGPKLNNTYAIVPERNPRWQPLLATGEYPPARARHAAIAQSDRDRMVVYGGFADHSYLSDVYALTWTDAPTPIVASLWRVEARTDRVWLTWFAADGGGMVAQVERRTTDGDWAWIARVTADALGYLECTDTRVTAGGRYGYRLVLPNLAGDREVLAETWVDVPEAVRLSLAGLQPNPASGERVIAFALPDRTPATLELIDIGGRTVLARNVGGLGPGSHRLVLPAELHLKAGVYLVRLTQGIHRLAAKAVLLE